jgi:hypothetical protein
MKCIRKTAFGSRCPAKGVYGVELVLHAANGARLIGKLPFAVCEEHRHDSTVAGLVSEEDWMRLVASFLEQGLLVPDRRLAQLGFRKIDGGVE